MPSTEQTTLPSATTPIPLTQYQPNIPLQNNPNYPTANFNISHYLPYTNAPTVTNMPMKTGRRGRPKLVRTTSEDAGTGVDALRPWEAAWHGKYKPIKVELWQLLLWGAVKRSSLRLSLFIEKYVVYVNLVDDFFGTLKCFLRVELLLCLLK